MKKTYLLFLALLCVNFAFTQVLQQDDFESYDLGNFYDQGAWFLELEQEEWAQITVINEENGKSILLNTNYENSSGAFVTRENFWEIRDENNNVLEVEFDLYFAQAWEEGFGAVIVSTSDWYEIVAISMDSEAGVFEYMVGDDYGALIENPQEGTWYHIYLKYNYESGEIKIKADENDEISAINQAGLFPKYFDFTSFGETNLAIDNIKVSAINDDISLISDSDKNANNVVFTNLANSELILNSNKTITNINVFDINGRLVSKFFNQTIINIDFYQSGVYIIELELEGALREIYKFVKE